MTTLNIRSSSVLFFMTTVLLSKGPWLSQNHRKLVQRARLTMLSNWPPTTGQVTWAVTNDNVSWRPVGRRAGPLGCSQSEHPRSNILLLDSVHWKKRLAIFPSPAGMSLTKLFLDGNFQIFSARESLVSDIPAGDGKNDNHFYSVKGSYEQINTFHLLISACLKLLLGVFNTKN